MAEATVLLADDHVLVLAGLRALVDGFAGFRVVGCAEDGERAVALAQALGPDLVVLDLSMPGMGGLAAAARLQGGLSGSRVIFLSMHATGHHVRAAMALGAAGYVLKDAAPAELEAAFNEVLAGRFYLSARLRGELASAGEGADDPLGLLTARQREILLDIARGLGTREIAQRLEISIKTVETHRAELMRRLDIHDVAGLTRLAIRTGLVSPDH